MTYLDETASAIKAEIPEEVLPDEDLLDDLFRLYALLARAKGADVTAEDVHDAWCLWMIQKGEDHPALRPFTELDDATRRDDLPFVRAIRATATRRR